MINVNPDLLAFLKEEETRARNEDLLERAEVSLNSYNGHEYGDEVEGRSRVVTRDVAEVIDQMEVSVLRVFVSGDRVVEFEPLDEGQDEQADDATEAIHRQFQRKGYALLHDWFKEGNISTLGIVKAGVEIKRERVEAHVPTLLMDHMPEGMDVVGADEPQTGEDGIETQKVAIHRDADPVFKDCLVPLEEFRISPDARDADDAMYIAHAVVKTLSELVEMGFDRDDVDNISSHDYIQRLSNARDDNWDMMSFERKGSLRRVLLMEEYVRFDADDDGIAERLCIHRVGDTILRIEPTDYQPFVVYCPFPMPGRLAGHSLAEKVNDIQRVSTVLKRLALDGLYVNLSPGYIVPDNAANENTYDDLLTVRPNRIIRINANSEIMPEAKNDVSAIAWQAMEQLRGERESRTGITRMNQGLDADALNKTATGTALMQAAGQQMEEYLARNFAEALARLMRLKLKLMSRYGKPMKMRVDGTFREVDPSQWPEEMDVITRVGLGSGRKEQRLANRMQLLGIQQQVMLAGLPIVGPEEVYKSIAGVVRDASLGSPADFVIDPSSPEYQQAQAAKGPPPPNPDELKLQLQAQSDQAKAQLAAQAQAAKAHNDQMTALAKAQNDSEKAHNNATAAMAKLQLEQAKAQAEAQMNEQRMQMQHEIALHQMSLAERKHELSAKESESKISANRAGGNLDE